MDNQNIGLSDFLFEAATQVPFYAERKPIGSVFELENWPLITGADLESEPLHSSHKFLNRAISSGSIFSSSGTSGNPKYALYTPKEITRIGKMLAKSFLANGLRPGQTVANLFVAGNLWSSFLAMDEALKNCGVFILPMGGLSPVKEIVACLSTFRPQAAIGLPSLLVGYAHYCEQQTLDMSVERIFYGGEHLSTSARRYLRKIWNVQSFHSAGYAAVDVGPIGWQCAYCEHGQHHLFAKDVHLEIVDGEAVVTSLVRRAMPIIRYRTGDSVRWVPGECLCGSPDPRFTLLCRVDGMMNLWGCHIPYADVEKSLLETGMTAPVIQVRLRDEETDSGSEEKLIVFLEQEDLPEGFFEAFTEKLFHHCRDIALTTDLATMRQRVRLECVSSGAIPRVARTGKVKAVVDER